MTLPVGVGTDKNGGGRMKGSEGVEDEREQIVDNGNRWNTQGQVSPTGSDREECIGIVPRIQS